MSDKRDRLVRQPHDSVFKHALLNMKTARELLRQHLPKQLQHRMDWQTLRLTRGSYIDEDLKQSASDLVYEVCTRSGGSGYIYLLWEHQSRAERYLPLRLLEYTLRLMRAHLKRGHRYCPVVVPMVLYNGRERPYPYSSDVMELFESPDFAREWVFKPFHLVDLSMIADEVLMSHPRSGLLQMLMKHIYDRDIEETVERLLNRGIFHAVLLDGGERDVKTMLYYLYNAAEVEDKSRLVEMMVESDRALGKITMTIAEQWRQEGVEYGLERGRAEGLLLGEEKGKQAGVQAIARKLLGRDMSIEAVRELTGLSREVLIQLKEALDLA